MRNRHVLTGAAAVVALVLLVIVYVLVAPYWVVGQMSEFANQSLGREFSAAGGSRLELSPLSIRIEGAKLAVPNGPNEGFISAQSMIVPISLGQLLSRQPDLSSITLQDVEIALLINERGQPSWELPVGVINHEMKITLERASLRYFDARNSQALTLDHLDGLLDIQPDGGLNFDGSVVLDGQVLRLSASLKSMARVNEDGSPLDLALAGENLSLTFSGRLSTDRVLSLSGPINMSGKQLPEFVGLGRLADAVSVDGAFDSAGRAFALRGAEFTLGSFGAKGDLAVDLRGERPRIQAKLSTDSLPLDLIVPSAGASPDEWGRSELPFELLRDIDIDMTVGSRASRYQGLSTAATQFEVKLADGKLFVSGQSQLVTGGSLSGSVKVDAAVLPPQLSGTFEGRDIEVQPVLAAIFGITRLAGTGNLSASLDAAGTTQEEMIGTLKGSAEASIGMGEIKGSDLSALQASASKDKLVGWGPPDSSTAFKLLDGRVSLADGVATVGSLTITAQSSTFAISGFSDLLRRAVELVMNSKPTDGSGQAGAVSITGRWGSPTIAVAEDEASDTSLPATGN